LSHDTDIQQERKKLKQGAYLALTHLRIYLGFFFPLGMLVFGRLNVPMLAAGAVLVLCGVGLRLYSAGVLRKDRRLQRTGPYKLCRNPLYLGTILIQLGFAFASGVWVFVILALAVFAAIYTAVILLEERWLTKVFGEPYEEYIRETPRLVPSFRSLRESIVRVPYSFKQAYSNHEHKTAIAGVIGVGLFLIKYTLNLWTLPVNLW